MSLSPQYELYASNVMKWIHVRWSHSWATASKKLPPSFSTPEATCSEWLTVFVSYWQLQDWVQTGHIWCTSGGLWGASCHIWQNVKWICRLSPPYLSCHSLEWRGEDSRWSHRRSLYRREQSCWWASSQRPTTEIADESYNNIKCVFRQVRRKCTPLLVSCTYTSSSSELLSEVMSYCTPPIIKSVVQHEYWESERSWGIQLYLQFPTQYALQTCIRAFRLHTAQQVSQESLISFHMT